ncbi:MAG: class I SAM-dependent rRNA methyltransferase [Bacteroidales bacterium]|nr:class I SAM-dependent rRNA methyltransferase [Bacteroidales bacterium]
MERFTKIILKSGKEQSVRRYHPWIFSGAIKQVEGQPAEGDIVKVFTNKGEFLATGHYQIGSIAVRIFSFDNIHPGYDFWKQRLTEAYQLRESLGLTENPGTNVYRLVNAEGDAMPGLIIDYYNGVAVMQIHTVGMYRIREEIAGILKDIYGNRLKGIYDKSLNTMPFKAKIEVRNEYLYGDGEIDTVSENGIRFFVDWREGQKTGFFIDQRENRTLLGTYAKNRKVLNMFCYTGGFSAYAMKGGATLVHSVDSSAPAIAMTDKNIQQNFNNANNHQSFVADASGYLAATKEKYDLIILDPPAFAKHLNVLDNALQGYKRLNIKAFEMIEQRGILFTFSCSQVVSKENFRKSVFAAAANTGRKVKILHQLTQPADHPVSIYHPEGEYLKGLVLYVE